MYSEHKQQCYFKLLLIKKQMIIIMTCGTCGGRGEVNTRCWWGNLKGEKDQSEDLAVDGMIILKCICQKWDEGAGTVFKWLTKGTRGGLFECSNKRSVL